MSSLFSKASRSKLKLRLAINGPAKAGKTYTALRLAFHLAGPGGRVAVIDTEHRAASKYVGISPDGIPWQFDTCLLEHFAPSTYELAIRDAAANGYDVLVIDSLSHAWSGVGGSLDQHDRAADKNAFTAWRDVTPQHNSMVEAILASPLHVIVTMRARMEYVLEEDAKGKKVPRKVGLKPVQREGLEYEFDVVCDIDDQHCLKVSGSRCPAIDGQIVSMPTGAFIEPVKRWLDEGAEGRPAVDFNSTSTAGTAAEAQPKQASIRLGGEASSPGGKAKKTLASATDVAAIKEHARTLGWSTEKVREVLAKRGATKVSQLSLEDAAGLLRALEKKVLEKEGKAAFA